MKTETRKKRVIAHIPADVEQALWEERSAKRQSLGVIVEKALRRYLKKRLDNPGNL